MAETIPDSVRTLRVPEVDESPAAFCATQVKTPASRSLADAMSSVTRPKSMLGTILAPQDNGLLFSFHTMGEIIRLRKFPFFFLLFSVKYFKEKVLIYYYIKLRLS